MGGRDRDKSEVFKMTISRNRRELERVDRVSKPYSNQSKEKQKTFHYNPEDEAKLDGTYYKRKCNIHTYLTAVLDGKRESEDE